MDYVTDWNCRLLPLTTKDDKAFEETAKVLTFLSDRFSFRRFYMMPLYDATKEPISIFLLRRSRLETQLKEKLVQMPNLKIKFGAIAQLSPGLHLTEKLDKLLIGTEGYLPILLPIGEYGEWVDYEINRLLFHSPCKKLIFMSFDLCITFYPEEIIDKLLRIPNAVFQFSFQSLSKPHNYSIVSSLLQQNRTVLTGSGIDSPQKAYYYEFDHYSKSATDALSVADYQTMLRRSNLFWNR